MKLLPRLLPLVAALSFAHAVPAHAFFGGLMDSLTKIPGITGMPGAQNSMALQQSAPLRALEANPAFKTIRSAKDMESLFERGTITGKEALTELKAIKGAVGGGGSQAAMAQLMGFDSASLGAGGDPQQAMALLGNLMSGNFGEAAMDMLITTMSVKALEGFFNTLTENPNFFAEESVELPKITAVLEPQQRQRVLVLAASLLAVKGSNKIIEASKNDFERAKEGYQRLIEKREKAAGILASALDAWRMASAEQKELEARKLQQWLKQEDLDFLASFSTETQLQDFAKDFTAQNIALEYLRKKGDTEYKEYKAEADEYVSNLNGHLRKTVGLGSLLGFSSLFLKEGKRAFKKEGAASMLVVLPFADQFVTEVAKAATDGLPSLVGGVFGDVFGGDDEFRIDKLDGSVVNKGTGASGVISFLTGEETISGQFVNNLYRDDNRGYFYRANLCNNAAADMLDRVVASDAKKEFAKNYYKLEELPEFTFKDAFEGTFQAKRKNELISSLLTADYRNKAENDTQRAIGEVQKTSEGGLSRLESRDVAQIIFASSLDGPLTHARLNVGDYVVRMIPSQWMVYEYENYQQNCLKDVTARLKPTLAKAGETARPAEAVKKPRRKK